MEANELQCALEAVLFAAGEPVAVDKLCQVLEVPEQVLHEAAQALAGEYDYGRHGHKITGDFQIHRFHPAQLIHILFQDLSDGDVVNAHLVFGNQMKQQIQRPVKGLQMIGQRAFHRSTSTESTRAAPPTMRESISTWRV